MKSKKKRLLHTFICVFVYIGIMFCFIPFVYGIVDDRSMMEFVSGQYLGKADAHAIFLGYWYSLLLSQIYRVIPNVDWYALGFIMIQSVCMGLFLYRILDLQEEKKKKCISLICVMLLFISLGLKALTQLSFTTTAAVIGVTVIFWYITAQEIGLKDWLLLLLLCFLTEQIRSSVFLMILPVCGIIWFFRLNEIHEDKKWNLLIPIAVLLVFCFSGFGNWLGYGDAEWKTYNEYNEMRSAVYDYDDYSFLTYEEGETFYNSIGIEKKSRARTLMNYNYTADDRIDAEFFGSYIKSYKEYFPENMSLLDKGLSSIKTYIKGVLDGRFHNIHICALVLYLGLVFLYFWKREWRLFSKVVILAGVQIMLWIYLLYAGRLPERVIYSMNLMMFVTALLLWVEGKQYTKIPMSVCKWYLVFAFVVLLGFSAVQIKSVYAENKELSRNNQAIEELKLYCMEHLDCFYFNDVTSLAFTTYNVKLWREEPYIMNYMSLGDWMSYSPLWKEKLKQEGITSVKDALYTEKNVYLICSFDKGIEYLVKLYDGVECSEVDKVAGFRIYQLELQE